MANFTKHCFKKIHLKLTIWKTTLSFSASQVRKTTVPSDKMKSTVARTSRNGRSNNNIYLVSATVDSSTNLQTSIFFKKYLKMMNRFT